MAAERKASRLENELQISQSSNKQRTEDNAKWENECEKLRGTSKQNEKNIMKLEREVAEQSGKLEAMKVSVEPTFKLIPVFSKFEICPGHL